MGQLLPIIPELSKNLSKLHRLFRVHIVARSIHDPDLRIGKFPLGLLIVVWVHVVGVVGLGLELELGLGLGLGFGLVLVLVLGLG